LLYAAAFFDLLARVAGRIFEDPPRRDFMTSTHVRARFATPTYIATDAPLERLALEAAQAADDAERHLAAHLRAFERFQGALEADRQPEANQRAAESQMYAHLGGDSLNRLVHPVAAIAEQLATTSAHEGSRHIGQSGRPRVDDVSEAALAVLFLGGLRIRDLENVLAGTRLEDADAGAKRLQQAADGFRKFGRAMNDWSPPSNPDLAL
jgi:hypothetical protein